MFNWIVSDTQQYLVLFNFVDIMLNWIVSNRTVWSFNCAYLQNMFTNHIINIYVQTEFGIKKQTKDDLL